MKIEKIVKPFYDALAEGRILGRKCLECGAIEYPPHYACNTCGYHATEWVELSGRGMLTTLVTPSTLNADPWNKSIGAYAYGIVEAEEGVAFNATVFGVKKKYARQLQEMLPLPVHAKIVDKDGCSTCFWELDPVEGLM